MNNMIMTFKAVIMLTSVLFVVGVESGAKENSDTGREIREYVPETWHAIETIPEGATGWIPRDSADSFAVIPTKRRRLRKRKRRPPIVSYLDQSIGSVVVEENAQRPPEISLPLLNTKYETDDDSQYIRRKTRPNTADPWEEVPEESVKPYIRRKVTPAYSEELTIINDNPLSATIQFGPDSTSNSDADISHKNERHDTDQMSTTTTRKSPNLKEILKQNGGLSLSEILQRKNLTLAELLMGKEEAINALTGSTMVSTTSRSSEIDNIDTAKYKRLPPSVALKKNTINRRYEQFADSHESLSDKEMMEAQRKRLALLQAHNYKNAQNGKLFDVTRYEVITEPTTERRIFVPSHPQLYTSIVYKPDLEDVTVGTEAPIRDETIRIVTTTEKLTTTTTSATTTTKSNKSKARLPITSAKLMKMANKKPASSSKVVSTVETSKTEEENYPKLTGSLSKPFKISVKDVFGLKTSENEPVKTSDEPLRMSIDLDTIVDTISTPSVTPTSSTTTTVAPTQHTPVPTEGAPKLKPHTAKEEILEILKDPLGREGLARILEARNMTIQELIEQRERGSSQLHLADIFHNKTREPEPTDEALEGKISSEVLTNFPVFTRKPKVLLNEDSNSGETSSKGNRVVVTAFPSFKIEVNREPQRTMEPFQLHQLYPYLFDDENQNNNGIVPTVQQVLQRHSPKVEPADILTEEDIQRLEDLDQKVYSAISNEQLNLIDENAQKIFNVSTGVKSAIVASLLIVGLSMIVFVTILFLFRWTQKRKKRLRYGDNLKPPLFNVKPRNIKTFVAETLGKKNVNYYKRHLHSISDDIWEKENDGRKNVF